MPPAILIRIQQPANPDDLLLDPEFEPEFVLDDVEPTWDSADRDYPDYLED